MFFQIELLYLVAMLAVFIVLLLLAKMPSGLALMCSAIVGMILSGIFSHTEISIRELVDGGFGYFDTILVIVTAMIFIAGLEKCGALDYISAALVKVFRKCPTVLLIAFMVMLMLPGMITGSSLSAVISIGAIVAPIMLKMGIPKAKVASIIAFGAILGMVAPPINIPVMVICTVVDIPYPAGFLVPLMLLTFPLAIFAVLFLSRDFKKGFKFRKSTENFIIIGVLTAAIIGFFVVFLTKMIKFNNTLASDVNYSTISDEFKLYLVLFIMMFVLYAAVTVLLLFVAPYAEELNLDEMSQAINFDILKELNFTVLIPFVIIVALFILQNVLPNIIGSLWTPLFFIISFIPSLFIGRKANVISSLKEGVSKSFSAMSLLLGVGMFMQVMTLSGAKGWFVYNVLTLSDVLQYVAIVVAMPIFGGISAFGSASILGGPFVMSLLAQNEIIVASALSLVAATGEFLPPTAMSATFSGKQVGEDKYLRVTKASIVPLVVTLAYAMVFIIVVAAYWA